MMRQSSKSGRPVLCVVGRIATLALLGIAALSGLAAAQGVPETEKRPVADAYHGTMVNEDYRWLERWEDPAVQAWSTVQNTHARSQLDVLPMRDAIRRRLTELLAGQLDYSGISVRGHRIFAIKQDSTREQPWLVAIERNGNPASQRVIVNPSALDAKGGTSIDWYVPSPNGALVAVSLSQGGSERGSVHVFDTATGKPAGDIVPGVHYGTAGGSLAWAGDSKGFYYTRYPRKGERAPPDLDFYTQVYFHALGSPVESDRYEIGRQFPRIAEIQLRTSSDGRYVLANVANGDGGEFAQLLRKPSGEWTQLTDFADKVVFATFGEDCLYLLSRHEAPRGKVVRLALQGNAVPRMSAATVVIPQSPDGVIDFSFAGSDRIVVTKSRIYVIELIGGPHRVHVYTLEGRAAGRLPLPPVASIAELVPDGADGLLYKTATFIAPPRWYEQLAGDKDAGAPTMNADLSVGAEGSEWTGVEVVRETAVSRDGTRVPLNIIKRIGLRLDGTHPTVLIGYGGYGVSLSPGFAGPNRIWLDQGGIAVLANIRGGGEFGEDWHLAGNLTKKQNVFDDFLAAAEYLIQARYTSADRLAIQGGSNGGLLMGAALTQRPDLFKAVVSFVGIYDMLRVELSPNGAFNVPEFGTVQNADHFRAMHAYSPYHRVNDGTNYPAVLFLTGANDPRVDPMQSRKMTARLQAATSGRNPILLRTSASSGHGVGTALSEQIEELVDVYSFLFWQLGVTFTP